MTPIARISAAIEVLDRVLAGQGPDVVLINWARANRYAGSGDRHAIRDLVFDALRCRRSFGALGGSETGRGIMIGLCRAQSPELLDQFTGLAHSPAPLTQAEYPTKPSQTQALDCPDWLEPIARQGLGTKFDATFQALQQRAPVFLRVNLAKGSLVQAQAGLLQDDIQTMSHPTVPTALRVTTNPRRVQQSQAYLTGVVELQDAHSQAATQAIGLTQGLRVLDRCAGGGGKSLAMAAQGIRDLYAYDIAPHRMKDIPQRAARAGVSVTVLSDPAAAAPYDLVVIDAPCSGSGSWRRDPAGKWSLTREKLNELIKIQAYLIDDSVKLLKSSGRLAYMTCSLLAPENKDQITKALTRNPELTLVSDHQFLPSTQDGDGFYLALLGKKH